MSEVEPPIPPPPPLPGQVAPIPVRALTYSDTFNQQRPGLITAIAVLAIVVACLSGLGSFITGMYGFGLFMVSRFTPPMGATVATQTAVAPDTKYPPADAAVAVNALSPALQLDPARTRELDKLLREHGKDVFGEGDDDQQVTALGVRGAVKESAAAGPAADAPAHFTTQFGRVDVYPDHATFAPVDGSPALRTSATEPPAPAVPAATTQTDMSVATVVGPGPATQPQQGNTLTPAQLKRVMDAVKKQASGSLNAAQLETVRAQLAAPNQQLVVSPTAASVTSVMLQGTNVMVQFDGGMLTLGPKGQVVSLFSYGNMATTGFAAGGPRISGGSAALVMLEAGLSIIAAVYLLVVGILVFRSSFNSPWLLKVFAWVKIVLAIMAGAAVTWMAYDFTRVMAASVPGGTTPGGPALAFIAMWGALLTVLGAAYPIGVLIALRSRTAREYFNTVSAS